MRIEDGGDLVLTTASGELRHQRPRIYQQSGGRRVEVTGRFARRGHHRAGFVVDAYNPKQALVIDPVLLYGTYVGASGDNRAMAVAVDAAGYTYLAGETWPIGFPRTFNFLPSIGNHDAFLVKLNPSGTAVVYATYFGGSGRDSARGVAVDAAGNAYLAGFSKLGGFPDHRGCIPRHACRSGGRIHREIECSGFGPAVLDIAGRHGSRFRNRNRRG
jgi:hypothetical protein